MTAAELNARLRAARACFGDRRITRRREGDAILREIIAKLDAGALSVRPRHQGNGKDALVGWRVS